MPSSSEHVVAIKTIAGADAGFESDDRGEEEVGAGDCDGGVAGTAREGLGGCDERGEHDGGVVYRGCGVVVVEFGCLDECRVHH